VGNYINNLYYNAKNIDRIFWSVIIMVSCEVQWDYVHMHLDNVVLVVCAVLIN
jgi:hypothetical protein